MARFRSKMKEAKQGTTIAKQGTTIATSPTPMTTTMGMGTGTGKTIAKSADDNDNDDNDDEDPGGGGRGDISRTGGGGGGIESLLTAVGVVGKRIRAEDEQENEERPLSIARTLTTMKSAVDVATHLGESAGGAPLQVSGGGGGDGGGDEGGDGGSAAPSSLDLLMNIDELEGELAAARRVLAGREGTLIAILRRDGGGRSTRVIVVRVTWKESSVSAHSFRQQSILEQEKVTHNPLLPFPETSLRHDTYDGVTIDVTSLLMSSVDRHHSSMIADGS